MRFDVITLFPELFAPHLVARRHAARLRVGPGRRAALAAARLRRHRPRAASTTAPTAAGRAWCCWPSRWSARWRRSAPRAPRRRRRRWCSFTPDRRGCCDQATVARVRRRRRARSCCAAATKASTSASSTRHVDLELSLGDFVLSGGELPALALLDAVARLQPGVLGDARSHQQDSFSDGLLDCPHYSRPERARPATAPPVPAVLLSGHHADDRALAARAVARADRATPARSDRRGARRGPARRRPTRRTWPGGLRSYNPGFSILCRAGAAPHSATAGHRRQPRHQRARTITRSTPWT